MLRAFKHNARFCMRYYCLQLSLAASFFFFNDTATTEIYTLSLHDALPISGAADRQRRSVIGDVVGVGSGGVGAEAVVCGIEIEGGWRGGRGGVDGDVERGRAGGGVARNIGLDGADRKGVVEGKRGDCGGGRVIKKKKGEEEVAAVLDAVIVGVVEEGDAGAVLAGAADRQRRSLNGDVVIGGW